MNKLADKLDSESLPIMPTTVLKFVLLFLLSLGFVTTVSADVTYEYTGNDFTTVFTPSGAGPYTTSDFISGSFTVASPLAADFTGTINPVSFSFTDGVQTITNLNYLPSLSTFGVQTDNNGNIQYWAISVDSLGNLIATVSIGSSQVGLIVLPPNTETDKADVLSGPPLDTSYGMSNTNNPGSWNDLSATPEPSSTILWLTGIFGIGLAHMLLKRKQATQK